MTYNQHLYRLKHHFTAQYQQRGDFYEIVDHLGNISELSSDSFRRDYELVEERDGNWWRPEEECPKNGEHFLVSDGEFCVMAEWPDADIIVHDITSCGIGTLTHWRPLPDPPKAVKIEE